MRASTSGSRKRAGPGEETGADLADEMVGAGVFFLQSMFVKIDAFTPSGVKCL